ncbi:hypothetical protein CC86DRAFT_381731 [Ophiobolus disseminans]|uniref:Uncharacterized protein n=1 Tax=Ophiobolus disseminans TaxID=1469910 RepID=A0A6A7A153_9PLEO|nr:hypothetical protein CC86DRAFT_381731 [Ophiobolus disseminans]
MSTSGVAKQKLICDTSPFEDLPTETKMMIAEKLLRPPTSLTGPRFYARKAWAFSHQNRPAIETAIRRLNKNMSSIGQDVLNSGNKWIVFDVDCGHLLLPWVCIPIPYIVVDHIDAIRIPIGIMRVKVELYLSKGRHHEYSTDHWKTSRPYRQLFVVEMEHFEAFLKQLRIMEFVNGVRVAPGTVFQPGLLASVGRYGLRFRVDVHGGIPAHKMRKLLELFCQFHGPLNEVCIQCSDDSNQARDIERSIPAPRGTTNDTAMEILIHLLRLKKLSDACACSDRGRLACYLNEQAASMLENVSKWDMSSGWEIAEDSNDLFLL